ncbi:MAG: glycosyltransferase family 2 protein [Thiogranum sp.]
MVTPVHKTAPEPAVSVFMSVYNGWPYIREAVDSVLAQTCADYEFIIVDDGSTDEGPAYLDAIDDPRVRIIHQGRQGLGKPLNRWMRQCRGEYIMRMDADDINTLDRIEKQKAFLDENREVIMVGCQLGYFTTDSGSEVRQSNFSTGHDAIVSGLSKGWSVMSHPAIMFRRSLLDSIEGYIITGAGEDYSLIMDAARYGKLANLPEVLYKMRIHEGSTAWENGLKTLAGFEYARKRHAAAEAGRDYPLSAFEKEWKKKGLLRRIQLRGKVLASVFHRKAKIDSINGRPIKAAFRTLLAAILDMNSTTGWILKKLKAGMPGK